MFSRFKNFRRIVNLILSLLIPGVLLIPGGSLYYEYSGGRSCARCHEIWQPYTDWHASTHRNVSCSDCHGGVFTLDAGFHLKNISRLISHIHGKAPEQIRLKTPEVLRMSERCRKCHSEEYSDWAAGPHGIEYADIFLNQEHNRKRRLTDDCLRCHGMHFEGGIRDLVSPLDTKGPWKLLDARLTNQPVIPCLACHEIHRQGPPLARAPVKQPNNSAMEEISRPSLALFDRRELSSISVARLPLPEMHEGARLINISPDRRQAMCYQCHAPVASTQVRSGDDRTPVGAHEGLSCFACHEKHGQRTRASCANCHPRLSNCGLNVETMDTTFKSTLSAHNIHFVKCVDCHTQGVPKKRTASRSF